MILLLVSSSLFAVALGFVVCLLHLPTTSSMVLRNVFGSDVNIEIDSDSFPSEAEIEEMDQSMPGCQHGYFKSTSHDNAKLHYRYWLPEGEVKGVAVFFHGINSHTGRGLIMDGRKLCTSLMSDMFLKQGICLYSLDMYGHGFSEGTRFLVKNWEYNKQDCIDFANFVSGQHPKSVPLFLAGESLGGCFAIHTAKHFQDDPGSSNLDSVLLSAPAVFADLPSFPTYQILRYILAPLIPKRKPFFMPHPISPDRIWRDATVREHFTKQEYKKTGLDDGGSKLRLGTALGCVLAMEEVCNKVIPEFKVPFCIIHGTEDAGVPIDGSKFMMKTVQTLGEDKNLHCIEGATHDMMGDPDAEVALGYWMTFVQERISKHRE